MSPEPTTTTEQSDPPHAADRKEFLLKLYDQLYNSINRYYSVVWQSFGVLLGVIGLLSLAEKHTIAYTEALAMTVLVTSWMTAHALDATYWFNQNLIIISNIERQFLNPVRDEKELYFFWNREPKWRWITYFGLQILFLQGVTMLIAMIQSTHLRHTVHMLIWNPLRWNWRVDYPYIEWLILSLWLNAFYRDKKRKLADLIVKSPGYRKSQ